MKLLPLPALGLALAAPALAAPVGVERPGKQLLLRLKRIAESGRLADPAYVASVLGTTFDTRVAYFDPPEGQCNFGLVATPTNTTYYKPDALSALKPTPYGLSPSTVARLQTLNPVGAGVSGPIALTYVISEHSDCSGYVRTSRYTTVALQVGPMPAYECVSQAELLAWLPGSRRVNANDGAIVYSYEIVAMKLDGAELTFDFGVRTSCLLGVSLARDQVHSLRFEMARKAQQRCMLPYQMRYCRTHPPFGFDAGDKMDEMDSRAVRQCVPLDAYLAKVPRRPNPIDETAIIGIAEAGASTPCSRVSARSMALQGKRAK